MSDGTPAGNGEGQLPHDGKIGNIVNSLVAAILVAITTWAANIDWSSWPAWVASLGAPAVALVAGLITTKVLPRFKR
jgi:hypothetical protein